MLSLRGPHVASPQNTMRVLITDGNERAALAAARSLVAAGHTVCVAAPSRVSLAGVSRGVRSWAHRTDALTDPAGYIAELAQFAEQDGTNLLLPMTDPAVEVVLAQRDQLPARLVVPFPDLNTYRAASNKAYVLKLAQDCGFAAPQTRIVGTPGDSNVTIPPDFFPAFVKPHRSVVTAGGGRRKLAVTPVWSGDECRRVLASLPAAAFPVLVQRRVAGVGEGFFALRWEGRTIAMFAHRRLREKPPTGGVSVYRESIPLDEGMAEPGLRLLTALDWQGVAMIECIREHGTGRRTVMEVNGRFWGSLQLAVDAGVDFPSLLVRCAMGDDVPATTAYRIGVRSRWFWGDVDHFYLRFRHGGGSRWDVIRDFLRASVYRGRNEVWRWKDPLPFAAETLQWLGILTPRTGDATSRSRVAPTESVPDSAAR